MSNLSLRAYLLDIRINKLWFCSPYQFDQYSIFSSVLLQMRFDSCFNLVPCSYRWVVLEGIPMGNSNFVSKIVKTAVFRLFLFWILLCWFYFIIIFSSALRGIKFAWLVISTVRRGRKVDFRESWIFHWGSRRNLEREKSCFWDLDFRLWRHRKAGNFCFARFDMAEVTRGWI